jgi:hypothetical protein
MDIDAIALGEDFVEAIETTVAKCDVLIAVIGKNWLSSKDTKGIGDSTILKISCAWKSEPRSNVKFV